MGELIQLDFNYTEKQDTLESVVESANFYGHACAVQGNNVDIVIKGSLNLKTLNDIMSK